MGTGWQVLTTVLAVLVGILVWDKFARKMVNGEAATAQTAQRPRTIEQILYEEGF